MEKIDKSRFAWVGADPEHREGISRPSVTYWKDAMGRLMKNKVAMVCLVIIVLIILSCVIVPFVTPFESREQHLGEANKGMFTVCTDSRYEGQNAVHIFGTDNLGRDLFVRAFEGGRVSLMIAFAAVAVTVYICIWVLALCVWIVAVALGGVGVVELLLAVSGVIIGHFPYALASAGSASSAWRSSLVLALGQPQNKLRASRRSGRGRPPRPSGRVRARRAALPRISRRRKE